MKTDVDLHWTATYSFTPILARQLGATDVAQSLLVSSNIGLFTLGNLAATALVRRIGARRLAAISLVLMSLGLGDGGGE